MLIRIVELKGLTTIKKCASGLVVVVGSSTTTRGCGKVRGEMFDGDVRGVGSREEKERRGTYFLFGFLRN